MANPPVAPPRATRHNPFNSARKETKTWLDIHNQIGAQIMRDREEWLNKYSGAAFAQEQEASVGNHEVEMTGDKLLVVL